MTDNEEHIGRKRVQQVFRFLEALHQLRNPVQKQINEHTWTLWLHDLPEHDSIQRGNWERTSPGVRSEQAEMQGSETNSEFVFKVKRPTLTDAPKPPDVLALWLRPGWERVEGQAGTLTERKVRSDDGEIITLRFDDDPVRVSAFTRWKTLRDEWAEWERPARDANLLFERLYALHGQMQRESESTDLVVGDGMLYWKRADGDVHYPVLIQRLQLEFHPQVPEFVVRETEEPAQFYAALFRAMADVDGRRIGPFRNEQEALNYSPLESDRTDAFLRRLASQLAAQGAFVGAKMSGAARLELPVGHHPQIGRDPVLFLRSRSQGFANALEAIRLQLPEGGELPTSLLNIVGVKSGPLASSSEAISAASSFADAGQDEVVLFSKAANAEQLQIAQRLERYGCVLVQGPPGTGKTHTIANLLGHLLAQGKTVLVTSHTTKALRVVREQVVESLRPLCVSVLGSDSDSNAQLADSVSAIVARRSESDGDALAMEAVRLSQRRIHLLESLRAAQNRLIQARGDEYRDIVIGGQRFAPSDAARRVAAEKAQDNWIPAPVTAGDLLPLTSGEIAALYATNISVTPDDERELSVDLPSPESLPSPADFAALLAVRERLTKENLTLGAEWWNAPASPNALAKLQTLKPLLSAISQKLQSGENWRLAVTAAGADGATRRVWEELLALIEAVNAQAISAEADLVRYGPVLAAEIGLDEQIRLLDEITAYLEKGGKLNKMTFLLHRTWPPMIQAVRIGADLPRSPEQFRALRSLAGLEQARKELAGRWERQVTPLGGPTVAELGTSLERACKQLVPVIKEALDWYETVWQPLRQELERQDLLWMAFFDSQPANFAANGDLLRLRGALDALNSNVLAAQCFRLQQRECEQQLAALQTRLDAANATAPALVVSHLRDAVRQDDPEWYRVAWERLAELHFRHRALSERRALLSRLEHTAPTWATMIRQRQAPHDGFAAPGDAEAAWLWRQLQDELQRRAETSLESLQNNVAELNEQLRRVTSELIEQRAWAAQLHRTTLQQSQALAGWLQTVRRITRTGKGKRDPVLFAAARKQLQECRDSVPIWIMPLARVVDSFDPRTTCFDVVIIDEASQLDAMGLIALYMAKSVVIVGDEEQVSPIAAGERADEVQHLIDENLAGVPNAVLYDGKMSVYQLAQTSFSGLVCLKEHFRCVPQIIQFSNHLSYKGEIKPLRDASRVLLKPHVIAHRVEGISTKNNTNQEEAQTIASLLIAATEQPEYKNSTFGVIALLGDSQAVEIDRLLQRRMSPASYTNRRIVCGNPAQFQGDERDVMFLSVVDSPKEGPLDLETGDGHDKLFKKRYNVAASRARDQMWVIHSLNPDIDLKPGDIRLWLIKHAENPNALIQALEGAERQTESEFERLVIRQLVGAGYRVTPQWKVGRYRIDMVVEGGGKRLAVECDGDRYHPLEKLPDDMARQAILERLGWTFVRIRGSLFFRDPDAAMEPVFARLEALGIAPEGGLERETNASVSTTELQERVVRRAAELRHEWAGGKPVAFDEPVLRKPEEALPSEVRPIQVKSARQAVHLSQNIQQSENGAGLYTTESELLDDEIAHIFADAQLFDETILQETTADLSDTALRHAIYASLNGAAPVARAVVLDRAAQHLGLAGLNRAVRSRLNKTIHAEAQAGRLQTDWDTIQMAHTMPSLDFDDE